MESQLLKDIEETLVEVDICIRDSANKHELEYALILIDILVDLLNDYLVMTEKFKLEKWELPDMPVDNQLARTELLKLYDGNMEIVTRLLFESNINCNDKQIYKEGLFSKLECIYNDILALVSTYE